MHMPPDQQLSAEATAALQEANDYLHRGTPCKVAMVHRGYAIFIGRGPLDLSDTAVIVPLHEVARMAAAMLTTTYSPENMRPAPPSTGLVE